VFQQKPQPASPAAKRGNVEQGSKNRGPSGISYKGNAAVGGAPIFASRWVMHFHSCARGFCITVAGRLGISTRILASPCAGSPHGRAEAVFKFCTKVLQLSIIPKRVSQEIPQTALLGFCRTARSIRPP
jgi:hypothetical protein